MKMGSMAKWRILLGSGHRIRPFGTICPPSQQRSTTAMTTTTSAYQPHTDGHEQHMMRQQTFTWLQKGRNAIISVLMAFQSTHLWANGQSHAATMSATLQTAALWVAVPIASCRLLSILCSICCCIAASTHLLLEKCAWQLAIS